jgi:protein-disulfide isomerase
MAAVLAIAVAAVVPAAGGHGSAAAAATRIAGQRESRAMLAGIPQDGIALGSAAAPVTLRVFADLQCPYCRRFALQTLPLIVRDYVRPGKVRIEYEDIAFLGPDSEKAAAAAAAAGQQDRLWHFVDLVYFNQGPENTGYVTRGFVHRLYRAVPGLNVARAETARRRAPATRATARPRRLAARYGVSATPSFLVGPTGGPYQQLQATVGYDGYRRALDAVLGRTS